MFLNMETRRDRAYIPDILHTAHIRSTPVFRLEAGILGIDQNGLCPITRILCVKSASRRTLRRYLGQICVPQLDSSTFHLTYNQLVSKRPVIRIPASQ
jgi:hypothetical protein